MELEAAKMIGAGLATIALAGVGVGIGNIFGNFVSAAARNPAAVPNVFGYVLLGFALTEAIALLEQTVTLAPHYAKARKNLADYRAEAARQQGSGTGAGSGL